MADNKYTSGYDALNRIKEKSIADYLQPLTDEEIAEESRALLPPELQQPVDPSTYSWNQPDYKPEVEQPVATPPVEKPPEDRGLIGDIASNVGRGIADATELAGHALKVAGAEDTGQWLVDKSTDALENKEFLQADNDEEQGEGYAKRSVLGAARSIPASIAPMATGAAIGMAAGPLGGLAGGLIGGVLGGVGLFGFGVYGKEKEEALKKGLTEEDAHSYALKQGLIEGGIETAATGIETVLAIGTFGTSKLATQIAKQSIKTTIKGLLGKTAKERAKTYGKLMGTEVSTEMVQEGLGQKVSQDYGMSDGSISDSMIEAIGPAAIMSLVFGIVGDTSNAYRNHKIKKALTDPEADIKERAGAANAVYHELNKKDPELAKIWMERAQETINNREVFSIDQDFADYAQSKTRAELTGRTTEEETDQLEQEHISGQQQEPTGVISKALGDQPPIPTEEPQNILPQSDVPSPGDTPATKDTKTIFKTADTTNADAFKNGVNRADGTILVAPGDPISAINYTHSRMVETVEQSVADKWRKRALGNFVGDGQDLDVEKNVFSPAGTRDFLQEDYLKAYDEEHGTRFARLVTKEVIDRINAKELLGSKAKPLTPREKNVKAYISEQLAKQQVDTTNPLFPPRRYNDDGSPVTPTTVPLEGESQLTEKVNEAATSPTNNTPTPTEAQIKAGNYKKGHVKIGGLDISVENPAGSERSGKDKDGKPWSVQMKDHYGYIKGTVGEDKDHIDVFMNPAANEDTYKANPVFVIDQVDPITGEFDEHKVVMGYATAKEARLAYLGNYEQGWNGVGAITKMPFADFVQWAGDGKQKRKPISETKIARGQAMGVDNTPQQAQVGIGRAESFGVDTTQQQAPVVTDRNIRREATGTAGYLEINPEQTKSVDVQKTENVNIQQAATADKAESQLVEHTTKKGRIIKGIVRTDLTIDQAKDIDPHTFKKDGGFFIREKYLTTQENEPDATVGGSDKVASNAEQPIKSGDVSVGDTVYFTDVRDEQKRIPANFRGFDGGNVVLVVNGQQMALPSDRVFKNGVDLPETKTVSTEPDAQKTIAILRRNANSTAGNYEGIPLKPLKIDLAEFTIENRRRLNQEEIKELAKKHGVPEDLVVELAGSTFAYDYVLYASQQGNKDASAFIAEGMSSRNKEQKENTDIKAGKPDATVGSSDKAGETFKKSSKSVRDNIQSATLKDGIITVTNKSGRKTVEKYTVSLDEWESTNKHPNPNWPKRQLVLEKNKKHMGDDRYPEDVSLMERIVDSQVSAINDVVSQSKKQTSNTPESYKPAFNPENRLLLIADSPESVRAMDLDRLKDDVGENWPEMRQYLLDHNDTPERVKNMLVKNTNTPGKPDSSTASIKGGTLQSELIIKEPPLFSLSKLTQEEKDKFAEKRNGSWRAGEGEEVVDRRDGFTLTLDHIMQKQIVTHDRTGAKLELGYDSNGKEYFNIEGTWAGLEDIGFDPDTFTVDERKVREFFSAKKEITNVTPNQSPDYGASNKLFTESAAEKARALLKSKLGNLNSGLDPEVMQAGITLAGYHIEAGARSFVAYSKAMLADLGEGIKPFLRSFYEGVRYYPGLGTEGMTSAADIVKFPNTPTEDSDENRSHPVRDIEVVGGVNVILGNTGYAEAETGREIEYQWAVIESDGLVASHDHENLRVNEAYPAELQPRKRENAAYKLQVAKMSNSLKPARLGLSQMVSDGSPVVGPDMVVESGNGRTIAVQQAYQHGKAAEYKDWLSKNAGVFGLKGSQIIGMGSPVLVRIRRTEMTSQERIQFASEANESAVTVMSAVERARDDARKLDHLDDFFPTESGDIDTAKNRPFINRFISSLVASSERNGMHTADGGALSQEGKTRIRNAIFAKAYGADGNVLSRVVESTDSNIRNITNGMLIAAPKIAKMKKEIERGNLHNLDITDLFAKVVEDYAKISAEGKSVASELAQLGMFGDNRSEDHKSMLMFLEENKRSGKKIALFLASFVDNVYAIGDPKQLGMFGEKVAPPATEIINRAVNVVKETKDARERQGGLFGGMEQDSKGQADVEDNQELDGGGKKGRTAEVQEPSDGSIGGRAGKVGDTNKHGIDTSKINALDVIKYNRGGRDWTETVAKVWGEGKGDLSNTFEVDSFGTKYISHDEVIAVSHKDGTKQLGEKTEKKEPSKKEDKKPDTKIEDFGEKIGGARKDYAKSLSDAASLDTSVEPLSKSFPEPNYIALLAQGAQPKTIAYIRALRDEIPNKPRRSGGMLTRYIAAVEEARSVVKNYLSFGISVESELSKSGNSQRGAIKGRMELYEIFGHAKSLKGIVIEHLKFSLYRGEKNVTKWIISQKEKSSAFSNMPKELGVGNTKEEAIAQFKERYDSLSDKNDKQTKFNIYSYVREPGVHWIGKKIGSSYINLKSFESSKEAREYLKENHAKLENELRLKKYTPDSRRKSNEERIGEDYRNGKDVSPEMFTEAFGFRGVEFGNWVTAKGERQNALNNAYDGLMDLAKLLGIPSKAISLNNTLGLAFGARGSGGINAGMAHYEPDMVVINLTRKNGAGTLAHEWWHALDNYFSRQREINSDYVSERPYQLIKKLREELISAYKNLSTAIKKTGIEDRSTKLDETRSTPYWGTGREISARTFENYVIEKLKQNGSLNDYLANIVGSKEYASDLAEKMLESLMDSKVKADDYYPYLTESEIQGVVSAFDDFFKTVKTKKTDDGVMLYSKTTTGKTTTPADIKKELAGHGISSLVDSGAVEIISQKEAENLTGTMYSTSGKIQGFTKNGKVYLIQGNIEDGKSWPVLLHELGVHVGNLLFNNKRFRSILQSIESRKDEQSATGEAIRAAYAKVPGDTKAEHVLEEVLAYMVEHNPETTIVRRVVALIKKILVKMGISPDIFTAADFSALAEIAVRGKAMEGKGSTGGSALGQGMPLFSKADQFKTVDAKMLLSYSFREWFGNSKMKNMETNEPYTFYHGSPEYFTAFDPSKLGLTGKHTSSGLGFFFSPQIGTARKYAGEQGHLTKVMLKLEKPYTMSLQEAQGFNTVAESVERRKELEGQGYDGVIMDFAKLGTAPYVIVFKPNQIKSAAINNGDFDTSNDDIRYSKKAEKAFDDTVSEVAKSIVVKRNLADMSFTEKVLSTPEYIFEASGATKRMFKAQLDRRDEKFQTEERILAGFVNKFEKAQKNNKVEYQAANDYLLDTDKTGKAFLTKRENKFEVRTPKGDLVGYTDTGVQASAMVQKHYLANGEEGYMNAYSKDKAVRYHVINPKGKTIKTFEIEKEATDYAIQAEQESAAVQAMPKISRELVKEFREMTNRAFNEMIVDLRRILDEATAMGLDEPTMDMVDESKRYAVYDGLEKVATFETEKLAKAFGGGKHTIKRQKDGEILKKMNLSEVIAEMGDLRGAYFPRQRQSGGVILRASKPGENSVMKKYDLYSVGGDVVDPLTNEIKKRPMTNAIRKMFNGFTGFIPYVETLESEARRLKNLGYEVEISKDESVPESVFDAAHLVEALDALLNTAMEKGTKEGKQAGAEEINKLLTMNLAEIFKGRGYLSSRIARSDNYVEGFETDMLVAGTQYARGLAAGFAKKNAARKMVEAITGRDIPFSKYEAENEGATFKEWVEFVKNRRLDPTKQKMLHQEAMSWLEEVLRNQEQVDRIMGTLKGLAVIKFLGFRVSSVAVNATNMVQAVPATISSKTGGSITSALKQVTRTAILYGQYRLDSSSVSESNRDIFTEISARGWDEAQFNTENAAVLMSKLGRNWNTFCEYAMKMFGAVEKTNRAVTIFAAYKEIRKNTSLDHAAAMDLAKEISDRAHGLYGKETAPAWTRGAYNPAKLFYTFQKFMHNYMLNMVEMGVDGNYKQAAYMLISPAILAGAGASAITPLTSMAISAFASVIMGGDAGDPEEDFYAWAERTFGSERFFRHGLFGLAGVNIKGSIQMNNPMPKTLSEAVGAPWGVVSDTAKGLRLLLKGELLKGGEALLPTAFGSMLKAGREFNEGITTGGYSPVYYGNEPLKADGLDATLRFFSFNPAHISGAREKQWHEKEVVARMQERRGEINSMIRKVFVYGKGDHIEVYKAIYKYNEIVHGLGRVDIKPINPTEQIFSIIKRAGIASKVERNRVI